jgi:hypothetical protein
MSPALIALLAPLLHGLLSLLGGTAIENWLLDHSLTWVAGFIARNWKLSGEWTLSGGVSNAAEGIVTVSIYRSGRTVGVFTVYALALTAAHQTTIAGRRRRALPPGRGADHRVVQVGGLERGRGEAAGRRRAAGRRTRAAGRLPDGGVGGRFREEVIGLLSLGSAGCPPAETPGGALGGEARIRWLRSSWVEISTSRSSRTEPVW